MKERRACDLPELPTPRHVTPELGLPAVWMSEEGGREMRLCELCHVRRATNVHHKLPRSRGGRDDEFNTAQLCGTGTTGCHGWVHANPEEAMWRGLTVSGYMILGGYRGPNENYTEHYGKPRE